LGFDVLALEFLIQVEILDLMLRVGQEHRVGELEGEEAVKFVVLQ
tara:strand:- start:117 stop:251 length:135 start_codon:yes stop_codon:yes gene_type:complete